MSRAAAEPNDPVTSPKAIFQAKVGSELVADGAQETVPLGGVRVCFDPGGW
jgi:hypothetical protein